MVLKYPSGYDDSFINTIKEMIDHIKQHGKTIQDLVINGQLTEEQFTTLIMTLNALVKSGEVDKYDLTDTLRADVEKINQKIDKGEVAVYDINKNKGKFDQTYMAEELLQQIAGTAPINAVPADNSLTTDKYVNRSVTPDKVSFMENGKNRFDKESVLYDQFVNHETGELDALSGYITSNRITARNGEPIAITAVRKLALYANDGTFIDGVDQSTAPLVYTPTQNGYVLFSFPTSQADISTVQAEYGTENTEYEPYYVKLSSDIQISAPQTLQKNYSISMSEGGVILKTYIDGKELEIRTTQHGSKNGAFNFERTLLDGELIHYTNDDITPIRTFNTVGANHGYTCIIDLPNTDKVKADLGSTWTDGTTEYVLLRIVDGRLIFACPYDDSRDYVTADKVSPVADLTHVANATNTTTIPNTGAQSSQLYPSTGKIKVEYKADGQLMDVDGQYAADVLTVNDSYNVLDYKSIVDFAKANIGQDYADHRDVIDGVVRFNDTYIFYDKGRCLTSHSRVPLKAVLFGRSGVVQSTALQHSSLPVYRYAHNVDTINGIDFKQPIDMATYDTTCYIYREHLIDSTKPVDRYVDYIGSGSNKLIAFSMGHVIDKTNSKQADRLANIPNVIWGFRSTKKSYPTVIENKVVYPGEYYNFQGYRDYYIPDADLENANISSDSSGDYIYIDDVETTDGIAYLSADKLVGKTLEVVDSKGFVLLNDTVDSNGVAFQITETNGYGVLKAK